MKFNFFRTFLFVLATLILVGGYLLKPNQASALGLCSGVSNPIPISIILDGVTYNNSSGSWVNITTSPSHQFSFSWNSESYGVESSTSGSSYYSSNSTGGLGVSSGSGTTNAMPASGNVQVIHITEYVHCTDDEGSPFGDARYGDLYINANITAPACSISSFTASSAAVASNTGTNLNFSLSGSPLSWVMSVLSGGSPSPSPASGTGSGASATGNLTSSHTYRLTCDSATQDLTVTVGTEDATVALVSGPSTLAPGAPGTFIFRVTNTGNTRWYSASNFKLAQTSALTISPTSGQYGSTTTTGGGTVSNSVGGTTVTGSGTSFLSKPRPGDTITIGGETKTISAVASNTSLTTTASFTNAHTGSAYTYTTSNVYTGDSRDLSFTLTAPATPGSYTLSMQNRREANTILKTSADGVNVSGSNNASPVLFGDIRDAIFTVSAVPVPVVSISANPTSGTVNVVNPGLTWSATNSPTSCTASGDWSGAKPLSGTAVSQGVLTTVKTYTYTLTCSNGSGPSTPQSATVVVSSAAPVPVVTISANPTSGTVNVVNPGLTWSATNSPTSCTASGDWSGAKAVSGTNVSQGVLTTVKTYTYTLTCSNGSGPSTPQSATVVVSATGGVWTISPDPVPVYAGQNSGNIQCISPSGVPTTSWWLIQPAGSPVVATVNPPANSFGVGALNATVHGVAVGSTPDLKCYNMAGTVLLATATVNVTPAPMTGTLSSSAPSCTIASGASTCNVNLTWTTTNPEATSAVTSSYPAPNTIVFNGLNGGPSAVSIPYNSRTFYLYNNAKSLVPTSESPTGSGINVTASCASGTGWDIPTGKCVPSVVTHIVTPSAVGSGTIFPNTPQTVNDGETKAFDITPTANFSMGGTCPLGSPTSGSSPVTYTTGAITADCTVVATFLAAPTVDIWVTPTSIFQGNSAKLYWSSNATSCTGTNFNTGGAISNLVGLPVNPLSTITYTVNCDGTPRSVTLTVKKRPRPIEE